MAARKPILEHEMPRVMKVLPRFSLRDQCYFILGLNSGFRATETLSLNVGDVWDQAANGLKAHMSVTRAKMKGGRGCHKKSITSRTVPLNDAARAILQKYLFSRFGSGPVDLSAPLFPSRFHGVRLTRWTANVIVHRVLGRAGLGNRELYGSHSLRKTFCRNIYQLTKFDVNLTRAVMGHASISTTQKYLVVEATDIQDAILRLATPSGRRTRQLATGR